MKQFNRANVIVGTTQVVLIMRGAYISECSQMIDKFYCKPALLLLMIAFVIISINSMVVGTVIEQYLLHTYFYFDGGFKPAFNRTLHSPFILHFYLPQLVHTINASRGHPYTLDQASSRSNTSHERIEDTPIKLLKIIQ